VDLTGTEHAARFPTFPLPRHAQVYDICVAFIPLAVYRPTAFAATLPTRGTPHARALPRTRRVLLAYVGRRFAGNYAPVYGVDTETLPVARRGMVSVYYVAARTPLTGVA